MWWTNSGHAGITNTGHGAGAPDQRLDTDVIHWTQSRDGKVIHARGRDGTAQDDASGLERAISVDFFISVVAGLIQAPMDLRDTPGHARW